MTFNPFSKIGPKKNGQVMHPSFTVSLNWMIPREKNPVRLPKWLV